MRYVWRNNLAGRCCGNTPCKHFLSPLRTCISKMYNRMYLYLRIIAARQGILTLYHSTLFLQTSTSLFSWFSHTSSVPKQQQLPSCARRTASRQPSLLELCQIAPISVPHFSKLIGHFQLFPQIRFHVGRYYFQPFRYQRLTQNCTNGSLEAQLFSSTLVATTALTRRPLWKWHTRSLPSCSGSPNRKSCGNSNTTGNQILSSYVSSTE